MASRNIGRPRGAEAGLCVMSFCMIRLTSLGVCASRLWVHGCNEERVCAAALINAWISVEPRCTVARVRKRLQASGIERGRSGYMCRVLFRFSSHCSLGSSSHLKLSLVMWCYLPRIFPQFHETCFMFLLCRMFTSRHPLRRCGGKQTPAAPEMQLRRKFFIDLGQRAVARFQVGL